MYRTLTVATFSTYAPVIREEMFRKRFDGKGGAPKIGGSADRVLLAAHTAATLGGFLFGYDTSNIGSALNFVPYGLHGLALGYLVSGASLGAAAGAILAGPAADRFGRKALLVIDAGIYAAGSILSAVTWHAFFIASFAVGVGGTGWTLQGEVFPTAVRGQAAAFCAMIDWLANFLIIEVFPVTQNAISLGGVMVVFSGLCALAIVFIWKFLPETKNLPVEEIVRVFERQQKHSALPGG
jgi:MFS family permease